MKDWRFWLTVILPLAWLVLTFGAAVLAPWLPLEDPTRQSLLRILAEPSATQWFGADSLGRDVFSRTIYGLRVTFVVSLGSVAVGLWFGTVLGVVAGYFQGRWDKSITALVNIILAFPPLVLTIAIMSYPGFPMLKLIAALGLVFIPAFARMARANTMLYARQDFVTAAHAIGMGDLRIILREIAPNLVVPMLVYSLLMVAVAAVAEASLSFLGLSVPPPEPSLGGMISAERSNILQAPYAVFYPAQALFLTIFALNLLGEHVQRRMNVREGA